MINFSLFKKEVKSNIFIIVIFMLVLTLYTSIIVSMFDPKVAESLRMMQESMPEMFSSFGAMFDENTTITQFLASYLYGLLYIMFPFLMIAILSNRLVTRYTSSGAIAYLLASPHKRRKIALTQVLFLILSVLLIVLFVSLLCIFISLSLFPGSLDISKFLLLNVGLLGLLLFFSSICFLSSCIFKDSKYQNGIGISLCIAFILVKMLRSNSDSYDYLKFLTPISLFDSEGIVNGFANSFYLTFILYLVAAIFFAIGVYVFHKKDISA